MVLLPVNQNTASPVPLVTGTVPATGSPARSLSGMSSGYSATVLPAASNTWSRFGFGVATASYVSVSATSRPRLPPVGALKSTSGLSASFGDGLNTVSRSFSRFDGSDLDGHRSTTPTRPVVTATEP